jgi:hypothetical protein
MEGKGSAGGWVRFIQQAWRREDEECAGWKSGGRGKMGIRYDTSLDIKRIYEAWHEEEQDEESL